ncbi:hypothetical protein LguiB_006269 [Lonicera macranthoides]
MLRPNPRDCRKFIIDHITEKGISRSYRDILPAHIIFKIESFSDISKSNSEKYQSNVFEAMGYNWGLLVSCGTCIQRP